jgi:hypothetical protein
MAAFEPSAFSLEVGQRAIAGWDLDALARKLVAEQLDRARGRVRP